MWHSTVGVILTLALGLLSMPLVADAQLLAKVPRIGILGLPGRPDPGAEGFRQGLHDLGYLEGESMVLEFRTVDAQGERLPSLAVELVRSGVDLILAPGPEATLRAVREATSTIPIVMVAIDYDPMALGYVASLPRPGGNITGVFLQQVELTAKRLELLKEAVPTVTRVAVFWDAHSADQLEAAAAAARSLGVERQALELRHPPYDFERAFSDAVREQAGALLVLMPPVFAVPERARIPELAVKHQLPAMFGHGQYAQAGGLIAYGVRLFDMYRRAASYAGKTLRREARRAAGRAAAALRAGHQPQDRQGPQEHDTSAPPDAGG